jgi:hypothetical protein
MEGDAGSRRQWSLVSLGDVDVSVVKRSSVSLVEWNQTEKGRNYWESLSCATGCACDASTLLVVVIIFLLLCVMCVKVEANNSLTDRKKNYELVQSTRMSHPTQPNEPYNTHMNASIFLYSGTISVTDST